MKKNLLAVTSVSLLSLALAACAPNISPDTVSASNANDIQTAVEGTIVSKRNVTVKGDDNMLGTGVGAVAGGIAGSAVGQGRGKLLATLGGAVLGGAAGNAVQDKLQTQPGIEYTIRLTQQQSGATTIKTQNGTSTETTTISSTSAPSRYITVVQGQGEQVLNVGQKVLVTGVNGGQARIISLVS